MHILILDIGTSSMRGILYNEIGLDIAHHTVPTPCHYLKNGYIEQDPFIWLSGIKQIFKKILDGHTVDAIGITAFRSAIIPVDIYGNYLYPCIMWQDKRNLEICTELANYDGYLRETTGCEINTVFSGSRMTWIKRHLPSIYTKATKLVTPAEYLMFHLTGNFCTDYTYGSRSHLMNLNTLNWDETNCGIFEIDSSKLSPLVEPGSCIGTVTADAAHCYGILSGTKIITSGGDQQCSIVGMGIFDSSRIMVNHGTGSFVLTQTDTLLKCSAICNKSSLADKYTLEYNVMSSAAGFDWLCKLFEGNCIDYISINQIIAETEPGADGVYCLPYFTGCGKRRWLPEARAVFGGISLNSTKGHLLRALLEGIAIEAHKNILELENMGMGSNKIWTSGGLTNSHIFNQIQADVYGKDVVLKNYSQATALGAFLIASLSVGLYDSIETAYSSLCTNHTQEKEIIYSPRAKYAPLYQQLEIVTERLLGHIA